MIDPFAATTIAFGLGTIGFAALAIERGKTMRAEKARGDFYRGLAVSKDEYIATADRIIDELTAELHPLRDAEAKRQAQRVAASKAAAATAAARAKAKREQATAEAPERAAKTLAALASTPMRSRAQVVAPVKAKRTIAKNAGGAAASIKRG